MTPIVAERRRKRVWAKVALLVAGTLCGCLLAEIGARFFIEHRQTVHYTIQRNSPYFSPALDDQSPLHYTNQGIETDGATYVSVRYSSGEARRFTFERSQSTYRVVAVGDSLTEQWAVPGHVNYAGFLESCLGKTLRDKTAEVIPLGVGGYNTWQEMHLVQRDFLKLQTDVLILQYCSNDGDVITLRKREKEEPTPAKGWPTYDIVGRRYGRADTSRYRIGPFESRLAWLVAERLVAPHSLQGFNQIAGNTEQREGLIWFRDTALAGQVPFFVVIFPLLDDDYSQAETKYIKTLLDELGIQYLDLGPELTRRGSLASMARDRYHPNAKGYGIAAEAICDYLQAESLLP